MFMRSVELIQACLIFLLLATLGTAQTPQAAIVGTCLDPSGAAIPGASVGARNTGTNAKFEAVTNLSGNYVLPLLPIGQYEVTASAKGFDTVVRTGIVLQVGDRARVDFSLEVAPPDRSLT
jgi:hypothetical protein